MIRKSAFFVVALGAVAAVLIAQPPAVQIGALYQCPAAQSFQVLSCAGSKQQDLCDVQTYNNGQPASRGKAPYGQAVAMARLCRVRPGAAPPVSARAQAQADPNGFKVGDTVEILTLFGWTEARILSINGNNYRVHASNGADVTKTYPTELRRIAPPAPPRKSVTSKTGQPPKPGLTSCAGKIEGRYSSRGGLGGATLVFRSGKATLGEDDVYECWIGGGKIYLHQPGVPDIVLDINNDGTLDSLMGEFRKKGN
jgi:hypothetical protein